MSFDGVIAPGEGFGYLGDRLVVLATIERLKKIEIQDRRPKTWRIVIESVRNDPINLLNLYLTIAS